jgi:hypothetical protein
MGPHEMSGALTRSVEAVGRRMHGDLTAISYDCGVVVSR